MGPATLVPILSDSFVCYNPLIDILLGMLYINGHLEGSVYSIAYAGKLRSSRCGACMGIYIDVIYISTSLLLSDSLILLCNIYGLLYLFYGGPGNRLTNPANS